MKSQEQIRALFEEHYYFVNRDTIIDLNERTGDGGLNNVVINLNKECFSILLPTEKNEECYNLFYASNDKGLEGHILELTIAHQERDNLTFLFAEQLAHLYDHLDILDTFNTFQTLTRSYIEKLGFYTINPEELKRYDDPNPLMLISHTRGVIKVPIFDKAEFYTTFFNHKNSRTLKDGEKYIYIMLNKRNNLFKIGSTKSPSYREKTLQAQEPEIEIVAFWCAPVKVEKDLHKKHTGKRLRGEWFNLNTTDLHLIKASMSIYE